MNMCSLVEQQHFQTCLCRGKQGTASWAVWTINNFRTEDRLIRAKLCTVICVHQPNGSQLLEHCGILLQKCSKSCYFGTVFTKTYLKFIHVTFNVFWFAKGHHNLAFFVEYLNFVAILISPCLASKKNILCAVITALGHCILKGIAKGKRICKGGVENGVFHRLKNNNQCLKNYTFMYDVTNVAM